MAYKTSTGLRNHMLSSGSLTSALEAGRILIYTGDAPATADAAVTGTLLCTISLNSTGSGFDMGTASGGVLSKGVSDVLSGVITANGVAGYYRHVGSADSGVSSTSQPRIQGSISTSGAEMNLSNVALISGATQTVDYYTISLPTF